MRRAFLAATILSVLSFFGCGGSSKPPAIAVAISPSSTQTVDQGQSKSFTAAVSNDSTNAGVTWSVAGTGCTGNACGTLGSVTTTGVTYTAPSPVSANLSVTLTATSVTDATKSATVGITVVPPPAVTTTTLASGTVGVAYSATLQASGGISPLTWSIASGSLPAGLTLNASTGAITGTPTTAGTANFTAKVADSGSPALTAQAALSITIAPPPLSITTTTLVNGAVNESYSATLAATGGTPSYSWSATGLPAGLSINASTGAITGTPTAAGSFTVNVTVTDSTTPTAMTASAQFTVTINAALAITTSTLANGTQGTAYSQTLAATGGMTPYTWSVTVGSLPAGLTLNSSTGTISGTPTTLGTSTFTVQVGDAGGVNVTAVLSIVIAPAPLTITTSSLPNGAVNETYNATLTSSGGTPPVTWAVTLGTLPAGLSLNASTGAITGTPTTQGSSTFTITATDSTTPTAMTATHQYTVVINAALAITTSSLANGTVNTSYSQTLAATGGTTPYSWSISSGALPGGLSLNSSTGTISGTPTASGTFNFTADVTDAGAVTVGASLSITVNVAPLVITSSTLPSGVQGASYSATVSTSGGTPPVTFAVTTGTLNAGLALNASTGVISGTPTTVGSSTFTITATDSTTPTAQTTTATYTLTVTAANNGELKGQYAFAVGGFDGGGYANSVGSLTADGNGNITGGVVDTNKSSGLSSLTLTGTYSIGSDNRGTMTITTSAGTSTMAFVVGGISSGVATKGHVINYDGNSWVTGQFKKQDATAFTSSGVNGSFAIGASGGDNLGERFVFAGRMDLNNGTISNGVGDNDTAGTLQTAFTFSGTYTTPDTNGRATATLNVTGVSTPVHMVVYVVSASEIYVGSGDSMAAPTNDQSYSGVALKQSGTFSSSSLSGTSVMYSQAQSTTGTSTCSNVSAGLLTFTSGNYTLTQDQNQCGTITTSGTASGTYTVSSNGRVTVTGGNHNPVIYLVGTNKAFIVGTNPGCDFGFFEPQTGGPFSASTVAGTFMFGSLWPAATGVGVQSGTATFTSLGAITGTSDQNQSGATSTGAINDTFSITSNGRATSGKGDELWYFISPSKAVMIDVNATNTNPGATIIDK